MIPVAKTNGLGWTTCSVDNAAGTANVIKNDVTDLDLATPRAVQDVTGIDKSAMERILNLADATVTLNGVFNSATNLSHDTFKTVPSTSVARTVTLTVNAVTLAMEMLPSDYQIKRGNDGALTWSVPLSLADGNVPTWA